MVLKTLSECVIRCDFVSCFEHPCRRSKQVSLSWRKVKCFSRKCKNPYTLFIYIRAKINFFLLFLRCRKAEGRIDFDDDECDERHEPHAPSHIDSEIEAGWQVDGHGGQHEQDVTQDALAVQVAHGWRQVSVARLRAVAFAAPHPSDDECGCSDGKQNGC